MSFRGKFQTRKVSEIRMDGYVVLAATAGTTANIRALLYDHNNDILFATGTDVPTDTTSGYSKGCLFIDRDIAAGTTGIYENIGTNTSCNFDQIGTGGTLAGDSVSLEHLDAGVAPHDICIYAGDISWAASGTTASANLSGTVTIASGDVITGSIKSAPTQAGYLVSLAASGNAVVATLSASNTSNDAVVSYAIHRAAS